MSTTFNSLKIGEMFKFQGDLFEKTDANLCWEHRNNNSRWKEWAFTGGEIVLRVKGN